ncbi:MAG: SPOR domain-containing protein [Nitrospirae bacterium]|nr:SPOR domain-containing protein [Nitrospirota bacterium]
MKSKAIEKTSIILLSKSTAVLASVAIAVISMVVGYLMGISSLGSDHHDESISQKKSEVIVPDEKRVLEPASANATQPSPITDPKPASTDSIKPVIAPKEPVFMPVPQAGQPPVYNESRTQQNSSPVQSVQKPAFQQPVQKPAPEPLTRQAPERSLLKNTQQDMKMPLIRGDVEQQAQTTAPVVQQQKNKSSKPRTSVKPKQYSAPKGIYTIQFGAFPSKVGADNLKRKLAAKNINAYVLNRRNSSDYYRVHSGSYTTWSSASKAAAGLKAKTGIDNFITKIDK